MKHPKTIEFTTDLYGALSTIYGMQYMECLLTYVTETNILLDERYAKTKDPKEKEKIKKYMKIQDSLASQIVDHFSTCLDISPEIYNQPLTISEMLNENTTDPRVISYTKQSRLLPESEDVDENS